MPALENNHTGLRTNARLLALILGLFFVSGAAALAYQVAWSRMMMQLFGSTAIAVGTVLAAFMAGLAAGSWWLGRAADRSRDPLRLYALLELAIVPAALGAHLALDRFAGAYSAVYGLAGESEALFFGIRFLMAFVLVAAPTFLMGGTLPILTRYLQRSQRPVGVSLSFLYAVNTLGAVAGVLLTGFYLIGEFGVHRPVLLAAACNLAIGLLALALAGRYANVRPVAGTQPVNEGISPPMSRLILLALGLSGMTSFAYEIYWTRSLVFILGNSTFALSTMLAAFLTGIALGAWLARYLVAGLRDHATVFGIVQILLGVVSALALPLLFSVSDPSFLSQYLMLRSDEAVTLVFASLGIAFAVMLVPAALIGTTLPLAGQLTATDPSRTGSLVGRAYAVNTLGNILGALLPGLLLLEWLGIQKGILAMAAINTLLGFWILWRRLLAGSRRRVGQLALPALLVFLALAASRMPLDFMFPSEGERPDAQTLYYREGPLATTKVFLNPGTGEKNMAVDGIVIGGTGQSAFKQSLLAHFPKLLIDDASTELTVGLGSAILAGQSARHPQVTRITGVEIEPGVIEGAGFFAEESHQVLDDPRLLVVEDDIGNFLRTTSGRYQVISADEKTADEYASNGFSYSLDYYRLLLDHLEPDGLVAQWVPATLPTRQLHLVLRTFLEAFPSVQLWYFLPARDRGPFNLLLIGSEKPIRIDHDRIQARFDKAPDSFAALERYGLTSALSVLPHFIADDTTLREVLGEGPLNTLDHPRYEFYAPWKYADRRQSQVAENHRFLLELKQDAHTEFMRSLASSPEVQRQLTRAQVAEFRYLEAFEKLMLGASVNELSRLLDQALAIAPLNDSLIARIYAHYDHWAESLPDPKLRAWARAKAEALYQTMPAPEPVN